MDVVSGMVISDADTPTVNLMDPHRGGVSSVGDQENLISESSRWARSPFPCAFHTLKT